MINTREKISILFVCLGNICRSPAAEGAFTKLVTQKKLNEKFIIDSCGTGDWHLGEFPHEITRKVANSRGIELTHKARQFKKEDLEKFDYILTMDTSNTKNILGYAFKEEQKNKISKFRKFDPSVKGEPDVPDPFYGNLADFQEVQEIIERTSKNFLEFILDKHKLG